MAGVASVLHYDPPKDHKAYVHRSGRIAPCKGSTKWPKTAFKPPTEAMLLLCNDTARVPEQVVRPLGLEPGTCGLQFSDHCP